MKILIGSNVHWWNAEAAYAATTAELLQKAGHQVFVLTRPDTINAQQLQKRGLSIITDIDLNTYNPFRLYRSYQKLKDFLQNNQIDIVNPHRSEGFFVYVLLSWALKSFCLIRTRGTARPVRNSWINRKIYCDWIDALILAGNVVAERLLYHIPVPHEKWHVIYYPVSLPSLPFPKKVDYCEEFSIPEGYKTITIVGRISPVKGHGLLLQSFQLLRQHFSDVILLILYKHPDSQHPRLLELQKKVETLGMQSCVRFIGPREDIREVMAFSDIGVVSSLGSEVICRVAIEFFSVGTPVVAFETGCLPEVIMNGVNGYIVEHGDTVALKNELLNVLINEQKLEQLSIKAREVAEERFNQERFLRETLRVFESCKKS